MAAIAAFLFIRHLIPLTLKDMSRPNLPGFRTLFPEFVPKQTASSTDSKKATEHSPANSKQGEGNHRFGNSDPAVSSANAAYPANSRLATHPVVQATTGYPAGQPIQSHPGHQSPSRNSPTSPRQQGASRGNTHGFRPYVCPLCDKSFSRPSALDTHMNSHTGDKPFVCDFEGCDKHFTTKSNMRRHSHVHTTSDGTPHPSGTAALFNQASHTPNAGHQH
ncbi:hypothetical protein NM688_g790 [Phlebia brevispora]|uniref:Uncharacterized protein n=1 Tax=Phlebia brevispora TaxID=194682 RepID=A0ACC1TD03_9APHY|nr:hypothetical protein NM688_g790 [Phlebia brevispora]